MRDRYPLDLATDAPGGGGPGALVAQLAVEAPAKGVHAAGDVDEGAKEARGGDLGGRRMLRALLCAIMTPGSAAVGQGRTSFVCRSQMPDETKNFGAVQPLQACS